MNHEYLWAPWRMAYLRELDRKADGQTTSDLPTDNFIAHYWEHPELDDAHHVVWRNDDGIIMLNRYPYANGHLLAALGEARPTLLDYDPPQRTAFWRLVEIAADLLQRTLRPQGINYGINQGRAAGAGVPEHLHVHLVPRWSGDTNFMTTIGQIRVIPDALEHMARQYREQVARLRAQETH